MTAVELLKRDLDSEMKSGTKMVVNWDMYLEVEKQQIIDAWDNRNEDVIKSDGKKAEQYYNETYGSKGSDETKPYWIGVVKWNDGTILTTEPFYQYQDIKVWSSKFSYENTGKFESIDYKRIDGSKDFTYTEAQKNEERVNNAKIIRDATSSQTEISDEEIEKWIEQNYKSNLIRIYVYEGIKWYREQLKKKQ